MPSPYYNDADLWVAFKQKNKGAFIQIFNTHYESLFVYGYKFTKDKALLEDQIQELFTELWSSNSTTEVKSIRAYLLKSLQYKLQKKVRESYQSTQFSEQNGLRFEVSRETLLVQEQEMAERTTHILTGLSKLSDRQREIIYLKFYRGMSYEEISEVMGINYQVTRNLLSRSLKALRPLLKTLVDTSLVLPSLYFFLYLFNVV